MPMPGLRFAAFGLMTLGAALALPATASAAPCASLAGTKLGKATITSVTSVSAGDYALPRPESPGLSLTGLQQTAPSPAFCRLSATLRPTPASAIRIEVWLPQSGWNGKFLGVASFGWGGELMYGGMLAGLQKGYAVASTDTGHDASAPNGGGGRFALGQPEKIVDYAFRATHEMTVSAKTVIRAFYGRGPAQSYLIGCSLGGLEGLIEAKRYPTDYDGIVAGAPPNPILNFNAAQIWPAWLANRNPAGLIPREKLSIVHAAALKACASPLGMKDGLIEQPDKCRFDPVQIQCKAAEAGDCLTPAQVDMMRKIYAGPVNQRTGALIFPGPAKGAELDLTPFIGTQAMGVALDMFRYMALQEPDWNWKATDWDADFKKAVAAVGGLMHVDRDLTPFLKRGKLLIYIGWNDYHNPEELAGYVQEVARNAARSRAGNNMRYFTIPGMNHCAGGAGCDTFDKLGAIDTWVTTGVAPERIVAAKVENGAIVRTRPLCTYGKVARYNGAGDDQDAANFTCVAS